MKGSLFGNRSMRAGVSIFTTDVVGNNELVFDDINGNLFPAKDVNHATKVILEQYETNKITLENIKETFIKEFSIKT